MNRRVFGFDPDAAVAPRRYGLDSLYGNYPGHHSMSGIRGDILDVTTPGWLCCPAFRYTVEEITNATGVGAIDPLRRGGPTHRLGKAGG